MPELGGRINLAPARLLIVPPPWVTSRLLSPLRSNVPLLISCPPTSHTSEPPLTLPPLHHTEALIVPLVQVSGAANTRRPDPPSVPPLTLRTACALPLPGPLSMNVPPVRLSVCVPVGPPSVSVLTPASALTVTV